MAHITYIPSLTDWSECSSYIKLKMVELERLLALSSYAEAYKLAVELQVVFNMLIISIVQLAEKEKCREIVRELKS